MKVAAPLVLMVLVTASWAVLGVIRDCAVVRNAQVQQALQTYSWQQTERHLHEQHQKSIRALTGREDVQSPHGDPPQLPEWVHAYIEIQEDEQGWLGYSPRPRLGGYLALVPGWWFHGTFAVLNLMLVLLTFVHRRPTGT